MSTIRSNRSIRLVSDCPKKANGPRRYLWVPIIFSLMLGGLGVFFYFSGGNGDAKIAAVVCWGLSGLLCWPAIAATRSSTPDDNKFNRF